MKIKVDTSAFKDKIEIATYFEDTATKHREDISRHILDLQDKAVKDALISLGWTPPTKESIHDFERWWYNEGSGIGIKEDEDIETFSKRVTKIAWNNGAYKGRHKDE